MRVIKHSIANFSMRGKLFLNIFFVSYSIGAIKALPLAGDKRTFGVLSATVRDSSSYPLVLDPFKINKVTCGSLLTLLDFSTSDLTVTADACLILGLLVASFGALPMLLSPKPSSFEGGAFGAIDAVRDGFVDVGQGVFDQKVAALRIPVKNIINSRDKQEAARRKIDISKAELETFNKLPKDDQEVVLKEAVHALEKVVRTHA